MATKKKPHPGVSLHKPTGGRTSWRAAYASPEDPKKKVFESLDPVLYRTAEARRDWAIRKTKELARRRLAIAEGAPRATGLLLAEAVERYFDAHEQLRASTLKGYRIVANKFLAWAEAERIIKAEDLTRARLMGFRELAIAERKHQAARGKKDPGGPSVRGKKVSTGEPRSAHTVNRELRSVRVVLGYLSELDLLPRLTFDDLRRALKRLPVSVERLAFLRTAELSQLFRASLVHDATVVKQTGRHVADATYPAIAPFLAFILFAGTRLSEAIELTWGQVDLEEGEVHLTGATQTKRARTLDLSVSDALRALLKALKRKQEPTERVFLWLKLDTAVAAGKRLRADFGAPASFTYHGLRRTCGTALTNSSIFGAASAYRSARQLGHSVTVAEKHYTGVLKGVSNDAKTVEAVLGIEAEARAVVEFTRARFGETVGE